MYLAEHRNIYNYKRKVSAIEWALQKWNLNLQMKLRKIVQVMQTISKSLQIEIESKHIFEIIIIIFFSEI